MASKIEFDLVDFVNQLGDAIDSESVLSNKLPRIYLKLQDYLIDSGQAIWNSETIGLDKI